MSAYTCKTALQTFFSIFFEFCLGFITNSLFESHYPPPIYLWIMVFCISTFEITYQMRWKKNHGLFLFFSFSVPLQNVYPVPSLVQLEQ